MSCWVKDLDNKSSNAFIWSIQYAANDILTFRYDGADGKLKVQFRTTSNVSDYVSGVVSVNGWRKLDIVIDCTLSASDRIKLYLDGVDTSLTYSGTAPTTTQINNSNFRIGRNDGGKLDEDVIEVI